MSSSFMIALPKKFKPSEKDLKRAVEAARKSGNCDWLFDDDDEPFDEKDLWEQYVSLREDGCYRFDAQDGDALGSPEPLLELLKDHVVTSHELEERDLDEEDVVQLMSTREIASAKKALRRFKD